MVVWIWCGHVTHDIVAPPVLLFDPCSQVWKWECQMSFKQFLVVHLGFKIFFCQLSSHVLLEAKGSKRCNHAPHNRAKYKDVTFLWFFKTSVTVIPCFVSSPFLHLECLIFAPVFINVSFNIVMCNRKVT